MNELAPKDLQSNSLGAKNHLIHKYILSILKISIINKDH